MEQKDFQELVLAKLELLERTFTRESRPQGEWVDEGQAAAMLGLTAPWFRRMCKSLSADERLPINYRHRNNRNYQYWLHDIEQYLKDSSTLPKKKKV